MIPYIRRSLATVAIASMLATAVSAETTTVKTGTGDLIASAEAAGSTRVQISLDNRSDTRLERVQLVVRGQRGMVVHLQPLLAAREQTTFTLPAPVDFEVDQVEVKAIGGSYDVWMPVGYGDRPAPETDPAAPGYEQEGLGREQAAPEGYQAEGAGEAQSPPGQDSEGYGLDELAPEGYESEGAGRTQSAPAGYQTEGAGRDQSAPAGYESEGEGRDPSPLP